MVFSITFSYGMFMITKGLWFMVLSAIFNNIAVISMLSALLAEGTGVFGENHDLQQVTDKLPHIMLHRIFLAWPKFELTTILVMEVYIIFLNNLSSYRSRYEMRYLPFHNTWYTNWCKQKKLLPKTMFSINIMYKIRD